MTIEPNFQRNISSTFPPENDACYIGRVKCFCATIARAKYFRDTFRPQLPVLYSPRKRREKSLSPLPSISETTNRSDSFDDRATNVVSTVTEPQIEPTADEQIAQHESIDRNLYSIEENFPSEFGESSAELSANSGLDDVIDQKPTMPNIVVDEIDSFAILDIMGDHTENIRDECETENIGDDCEMIVPFGVNFKPKVDQYQTKMNDPISENIPFKENVSNLE